MRALDLCGLKFSTYGSLFNMRKPKLGTSTDYVRDSKSSVERLQDFACPGRLLTLRSRLSNMSCQKFFFSYLNMGNRNLSLTWLSNCCIFKKRTEEIWSSPSSDAKGFITNRCKGRQVAVYPHCLFEVRLYTHR